VQTGLDGSAFGAAVASMPYQLDAMLDEITARVGVVADVDEPWVSFFSPVDGALIGGGVDYYVAGGAAGDDTTWIERVELELPAGVGKANAEGSGLWSYTWELPADGIYTLQARSFDQVGHASPAEAVQVTVDNTPPAVSLDWNESEFVSAVVGEAITLTLTGGATDNLSGLTRVQVSTDGRPWREVWSGDESPSSVVWSTEWRIANQTSAQGDHIVAVRAWDLAGNQSEPMTRTLLVDVVPPTARRGQRCGPHAAYSAASRFKRHARCHRRLYHMVGAVVRGR
jgi:hypothetical protein